MPSKHRQRVVSVTRSGEILHSMRLPTFGSETVARVRTHHILRLPSWPVLGVTMRTGKIFVAISIAVVALTPEIAAADEGGVSFWIPGFFGSLAATPQQPGWSG